MKAKVIVQPCEYGENFVTTRFTICGPSTELHRAVEEFQNLAAVRARIATLRAQFDGVKDCQIHIWSIDGSRKVAGFDKLMSESRALLYCRATPAARLETDMDEEEAAEANADALADTPAPGSTDEPAAIPRCPEHQHLALNDPSCHECSMLQPDPGDPMEPGDDPMNDFNYRGSRHHY